MRRCTVGKKTFTVTAVVIVFLLICYLKATKTLFPRGLLVTSSAYKKPKRSACSAAAAVTSPLRHDAVNANVDRHSPTLDFSLNLVICATVR